MRIHYNLSGRPNEPAARGAHPGVDHGKPPCMKRLIRATGRLRLGNYQSRTVRDSVRKWISGARMESTAAKSGRARFDPAEIREGKEVSMRWAPRRRPSFEEVKPG